MLDLGCGKGAVAVEVASRIGCRVLGIDAFAPFVADCDAVVLLNVFPFERAIGVARRLTKPGGCYVIDDAIAVKRTRDSSHFPSSADIERAIEDAGDREEQSKVWSGAEVRSREKAVYELLRKNAEAGVRKRAADRALIEECLRRKRAAISELSGSVRPGWWLVRRGRK